MNLRKMNALSRALTAARKHAVNNGANPPADDAEFVRWLLVELKWFRKTALRYERRLFEIKLAKRGGK